MKTTVTLTVQDLIDAKKLSIRPKKIYLAIIAPLLVLVLFFLGYGIYNATTRDNPDLSWLWTVGIATYFGLIYYLVVYHSAKKQFRQNKRLSEAFELEITEDGFRTKASFGESEIKFRDFYKWKFNDKTVLLYHSDVLFQMIPTRAFLNESERLDVIGKIRKHAGSPVK